MTPKVENNRFEKDATRYADYLGTPEGRLRADLAFANVCEFLPEQVAAVPLTALDVGCGTGAAAVRLSQRGMNVTAVDMSSAMLALAKNAITEAEVSDRVTLKFGDAGRLKDMFQEKSFDVVICHNVLEFVDSPEDVLRDLECVMRDSSSILSILVRNQAGEVLKSAIQAGDLAAAEKNLTAEWGTESLYQGALRLFTAEALEAMIKETSLEIISRRGVRVVTDYLPAKISRSAEYERITSLERKLARRQEFFRIARYIQFIARPEER